MANGENFKHRPMLMVGLGQQQKNCVGHAQLQFKLAQPLLAMLNIGILYKHTCV